jgi:hypothetical protein
VNAYLLIYTALYFFAFPNDGVTSECETDLGIDARKMRDYCSALQIGSIALEKA